MGWSQQWSDLQVKVNGAFASTFLRSGHGTSRNSSRGRGEGRSWRGVVDAAAEVRLIILVHFRLLIYPRRLTRDGKSMVHLRARSWEWGDLRWKVNSAFVSTFLRSGHGTSRNSSRGIGEGRSWRRVVDAVAEVRLIILVHFRLLIYPRRLEEWQISCLPGLWASESRAPLRAEESSGTPESVVSYHVIAGGMRKSYLLYKVTFHVRLSSSQILINDDDEKTDASGPGKRTEVLRSGSPSAIRRSARYCVVSLRVV